jgi:hypothetical protein
MKLTWALIAVFLAGPVLAGRDVGTTGSLSVSPRYLNFGSVKVNSYSYNQQAISIFNQGDQRVEVQVSGYCGQHYTVHNSCYSLAQYGSCRIVVDYRPKMIGSHTCSLSIRGSDGSYDSISIQGRGI